jgi:S1-C subfamily serine protease
MHKILLFSILVVLALVPVKASDDWTNIVDKVLKSVVYIENDESACTGFVIDQERKYVLSAAHCDADKVWVDRVTSRAISKDTKKDLVVYEVKDLDPSRPALKLASHSPEIGQEVLSVGYGMALERPFFRKAMVSDTAVQIPDYGGPFIALDAAFVGGQSGGPVVNHAGEVVMIVQAANGTTGIGVSADTIRERTGRFWSQK